MKCIICGKDIYGAEAVHTFGPLLPAEIAYCVDCEKMTNMYEKVVEQTNLMGDHCSELYKKKLNEYLEKTNRKIYAITEDKTNV